MIERVSGLMMAALVFGALCWAMLGLPAEPAGLVHEAFEALERSGVSNPVTAVLLNYRAYDTLLEMAVLLLAAVGVWSLRTMPVTQFEQRCDPLLAALLRFLLPLLLVTGGYLLWIGSSAPGGAFQGGALLGGALVLMLLGGRVSRRVLTRTSLLRAGLWLGLLIFCGVGLAMTFGGRAFLEYPPERAGTLILLIETGAMLSIGVTLAALFFGGRPEAETEDSLEGEP
jgi:multisubunit Na+/H+ antiporter MnhB subunit